MFINTEIFLTVGMYQIYLVCWCAHRYSINQADSVPIQMEVDSKVF